MGQPDHVLVVTELQGWLLTDSCPRGVAEGLLFKQWGSRGHVVLLCLGGMGGAAAASVCPAHMSHARGFLSSA